MSMKMKLSGENGNQMAVFSPLKWHFLKIKKIIIINWGSTSTMTFFGHILKHIDNSGKK